MASARWSWGAPPVTCTRRWSRRSARHTSCAGACAEAANVLDAGLEAARLAGITQSTAWMLRNQALLAVAVG